MSHRASSWAWAVQTTPTIKLVLMALADHADEAGLCWPSIARLRAFTCLSERAIRDALRDLEKAGLVVTDKREGMISRYTLSIGSAPEPRQEMPGSDTTTPAPAAGDPGATCRGPRQEMPGTPAPGAPEPSRTVKEPPLNRQGVALRASPTRAEPRGHRLPEDWMPSREDRDFAAGLGLHPDAVTAEFKDFWTGVPGAKGRKVSWSGTFRNSCRMQASRKPANRQSESKLGWMLAPRSEDHQ